MHRQPSSIKIFGAILFAPLSFLGQLLNLFLFSPWGLIVPMTLLIALLAAQQLQKTPAQLAMFYAEQFETCGDEELPRLLEVLVRMDEPGIPGLVKGLNSQRESVFTACLNILQCEFDRWTESDQREHHYRIFSEALLDSCSQFSHAAQAETMQFVYQMMQIRSAAAVSPESTANRQKTIAHCEQLLSRLESMRRRRAEPMHDEFAPTANTVASLDRRTSQPMLYASNGQPFLPTSARNDIGETQPAQVASFNTFSVERADRLAAYQKAKQNRPPEGRSNPRLPEDHTTPVLANFSAPPSFAATAESKFAQQFSLEDSDHVAAPDRVPPNISQEYRNKKLSESGGAYDSDNPLSPELQNTPLDRVPHLPTTQLMQLLHHPETSYVEVARRTLMSRDGFQEVHMKLAWRLYHPIPSVRQEILDILPGTPNVQASVWMTVLLHDPNNDVRYRTASFLATAGDPALRRLLIDRGRRDSDARIVNLANRLNEPQRGSVR